MAGGIMFVLLAIFLAVSSLVIVAYLLSWWIQRRELETSAKDFVESAKPFLASGSPAEVSAGIAMLRSALKRAPWLEETLREGLVRALMRLQRYEEVVDVLKDCLPDLSTPLLIALEAQDEQHLEMWQCLMLGQATYHLGWLDQALVLLRRAKHMSLTAYRREAAALEDDYFRDAEAATSPLETLNRLILIIRFLLWRQSAGDAAYAAGLFHEAVRHYSKVLDSKKGIPQALAAALFLRRAVAFRAAGQVADAIADCSRAFALEPHRTDALWCRAELYRSVGCFQEASEDLRELLGLLEAAVRSEQKDDKGELGVMQPLGVRSRFCTECFAATWQGAPDGTNSTATSQATNAPRSRTPGPMWSQRRSSCYWCGAKSRDLLRKRTWVQAKLMSSLTWVSERLLGLPATVRIQQLLQRRWDGMWAIQEHRRLERIAQQAAEASEDGRQWFDHGSSLTLQEKCTLWAQVVLVKGTLHSLHQGDFSGPLVSEDSPGGQLRRGSSNSQALVSPGALHHEARGFQGDIKKLLGVSDQPESAGGMGPTAMRRGVQLPLAAYRIAAMRHSEVRSLQFLGKCTLRGYRSHEEVKAYLESEWKRLNNALEEACAAMDEQDDDEDEEEDEEEDHSGPIVVDAEGAVVSDLDVEASESPDRGDRVGGAAGLGSRGSGDSRGRRKAAKLGRSVKGAFAGKGKGRKPQGMKRGGESKSGPFLQGGRKREGREREAGSGKGGKNEGEWWRALSMPMDKMKELRKGRVGGIGEDEGYVLGADVFGPRARRIAEDDGWEGMMLLDQETSLHDDTLSTESGMPPMSPKIRAFQTERWVEEDVLMDGMRLENLDFGVVGDVFGGLGNLMGIRRKKGEGADKDRDKMRDKKKAVLPAALLKKKPWGHGEEEEEEEMRGGWGEILLKASQKEQKERMKEEKKERAREMKAAKKKEREDKMLERKAKKALAGRVREDATTRQEGGTPRKPSFPAEGKGMGGTPTRIPGMGAPMPAFVRKNMGQRDRGRQREKDAESESESDWEHDYAADSFLSSQVGSRMEQQGLSEGNSEAEESHLGPARHARWASDGREETDSESGSDSDKGSSWEYQASTWDTATSKVKAGAGGTGPVGSLSGGGGNTVGLEGHDSLTLGLIPKAAGTAEAAPTGSVQEDSTGGRSRQGVWQAALATATRAPEGTGASAQVLAGTGAGEHGLTRSAPGSGGLPADTEGEPNLHMRRLSISSDPGMEEVGFAASQASPRVSNGAMDARADSRVAKPGLPAGERRERGARPTFEAWAEGSGAEGGVCEAEKRDESPAAGGGAGVGRERGQSGEERERTASRRLSFPGRKAEGSLERAEGTEQHGLPPRSSSTDADSSSAGKDPTKESFRRKLHLKGLPSQARRRGAVSRSGPLALTKREIQEYAGCEAQDSLAEEPPAADPASAAARNSDPQQAQEDARRSGPGKGESGGAPGPMGPMGSMASLLRSHSAKDDRGEAGGRGPAGSVLAGAKGSAKGSQGAGPESGLSLVESRSLKSDKSGSSMASNALAFQGRAHSGEATTSGATGAGLAPMGTGTRGTADPPLPDRGLARPRASGLGPGAGTGAGSHDNRSPLRGRMAGGVAKMGRAVGNALMWGEGDSRGVDGGQARRSVLHEAGERGGEHAEGGGKAHEDGGRALPLPLAGTPGGTPGEDGAYRQEAARTLLGSPLREEGNVRKAQGLKKLRPGEAPARPASHQARRKGPEGALSNPFAHSPFGSNPFGASSQAGAGSRARDGERTFQEADSSSPLTTSSAAARDGTDRVDERGPSSTPLRERQGSDGASPGWSMGVHQSGSGSGSGRESIGREPLGSGRESIGSSSSSSLPVALVREDSSGDSRQAQAQAQARAQANAQGSASKPQAQGAPSKAQASGAGVAPPAAKARPGFPGSSSLDAGGGLDQPGLREDALPASTAKRSASSAELLAARKSQSNQPDGAPRGGQGQAMEAEAEPGGGQGQPQSQPALSLRGEASQPRPQTPDEPIASVFRPRTASAAASGYAAGLMEAGSGLGRCLKAYAANSRGAEAARAPAGPHKGRPSDGASAGSAAAGSGAFGTPIKAGAPARAVLGGDSEGTSKGTRGLDQGLEFPSHCSPPPVPAQGQRGGRRGGEANEDEGGSGHGGRDSDGGSKSGPKGQRTGMGEGRRGHAAQAADLAPGLPREGSLTQAEAHRGSTAGAFEDSRQASSYSASEHSDAGSTPVPPPSRTPTEADPARSTARAEQPGRAGFALMGRASAELSSGKQGHAAQRAADAAEHTPPQRIESLWPSSIWTPTSPPLGAQPGTAKAATPGLSLSSTSSPNLPSAVYIEGFVPPGLALAAGQGQGAGPGTEGGSGEGMDGLEGLHSLAADGEHNLPLELGSGAGGPLAAAEQGRGGGKKQPVMAVIGGLKKGLRTGTQIGKKIGGAITISPQRALATALGKESDAAGPVRGHGSGAPRQPLSRMHESSVGAAGPAAPEEGAPERTTSTDVMEPEPESQPPAMEEF